MKIGERLETAFWLAGDETTEHVRQFQQDCQDVFAARAAAEGFLVGPVAFEIKLPGQDRVPDTPKWLEQKCASIGRRLIALPTDEGHEGPPVQVVAPVLLVAEVTVLCRAPRFRKRTFVGDLCQKDLARLRSATRRTLRRPDMHDVEVDDIIEQAGPEAAFDAVLDSLPTRGLRPN